MVPHSFVWTVAFSDPAVNNLEDLCRSLAARDSQVFVACFSKATDFTTVCMLSCGAAKEKTDYLGVGKNEPKELSLLGLT